MTRVLVPMDQSDPAEDALEFAIEEISDPELSVLHVVDFAEAAQATPPGVGMGSYLEEWEEAAEREAEEIFELARERAPEDVPVETATRIGPPGRTICEYAEEIDADHVVVGSHGRTGATRVLLGSVAESVVRRAPCPVTVVR